MKIVKTTHKRLRSIQLFWGLFIGNGWSYLKQKNMITEIKEENYDRN